MKTEQKDDAENNGRQKNLADMVVENLLVGIRGVTDVGFFRARCFAGDDGSGCGRYVLFCVHVLDSLGCNTELCLRLAQRCSWGVPLMFQGQGCL